MPFKSIRARLTAAFSLSLAIIVMATIFGLIWYSQRSAERSADNLLATTTKRALLETSNPREHYDPNEMIEEFGEGLRGSNLTLSVIDQGGNVIGKSQRNAPGLSSINDSNWRISVVKLKNGDFVVVGMPWAKTRSTLRYHAIALIWLGAFIVVISSVGAWLLVGRTLTPISALARQANASSAEDLSISLKSPSHDYEMLELVETLNALLRRVTETTAAKGRFYSAASHELRTPLQALSGHLELALSRDRTKEEYKAATEEAYVQTKRLISLVHTLLFLYQLDSSAALPGKKTVDLADVCRRSLSQFQPLIEERGLHISMTVPEKAGIFAPLNYIDILVRNLVENAVKYAAERGCINIAIATDGSSTCLDITNDCTTPPNWKSEQLFEPFYRPDSSRNAKTGGTGLGLAICKSIADINGWRLEVVSEEQSVKAALTIPCAATQTN